MPCAFCPLSQRWRHSHSQVSIISRIFSFVYKLILIDITKYYHHPFRFLSQILFSWYFFSIEIILKSISFHSLETICRALNCSNLLRYQDNIKSIFSLDKQKKNDEKNIWISPKNRCHTYRIVCSSSNRRECS